MGITQVQVWSSAPFLCSIRIPPSLCGTLTSLYEGHSLGLLCSATLGGMGWYRMGWVGRMVWIVEFNLLSRLSVCLSTDLSIYLIISLLNDRDDNARTGHPGEGRSRIPFSLMLIYTSCPIQIFITFTFPLDLSLFIGINSSLLLILLLLLPLSSRLTIS